MKREVLVVEDDRDTRELLSELLKLEGYSTKTAENGRDAIRTMTQNVPDLIVLDLRMPVMNGTEVLELLAKLPVFQKVPVITISSEKESPDSPQVCFAFQKPLDFDSLATKIEEALMPERASP